MNRFDPPEPESDGGPEPELADRLDERVVTIPCYEPAGRQVEFTGRDLVTHTLVLGQTGASKTTAALRWFIKGLIRHHAQEPSQKAAVFIFDLNDDANTVGLVHKWAAEAGRSSDVRVLSAEAGYLDLFANVQTFQELSFATAQFMNGAWARDTENGYWSDTARALIDAALSICLVVTGRLETDIVIRFLTNWLIAKRPSKEDEKLLENFESICVHADGHLDKLLLGKLEHVRATAEVWAKIDSKTRGILASCLLNALGPLISLETRRFIDSARGGCFVPEEIVEGRIMVFTAAAGRNLESAKLLARLIKARLYVALQGRKQDRNQRLCGVLADEYHYLATGGDERSSDVIALATLRSRNVAVIAATQSLDHLASVMTVREFRSLIPNFGTHIFFRSTEASTGAFATQVMGTREKVKRSDDDEGNLVVGSPVTRSLEYVCPPGALASLEPAQAYVSTASGYRSEGMIWLAANHESCPVAPAKANLSTDVDPLQKIRDSVLPKPKAAPALSTSAGGVHQSGLVPVTAAHYYDLPAWQRLIQEPRFKRARFSSFAAFRQALANFGHQPTGLDSLPICWWASIVKLVIQFGQQHRMKLLALHQIDGCLEVMLSGTDAPADEYFDWIKTVQNSIYPIRTRPLKRRDHRLLVEEMETDLFDQLPDETNQAE